MMDNKTISFIISSLPEKATIILATITVLLVLIISLPILFIFGLHYSLTTLLASRLRPDLCAVSGLDPWFATEPVYSHPYTNIVWHLICEGAISVEELREIFKERVLEYREPGRGFVYRRLRHKLTTFLGYFFWEPEASFNINHHIRLYDYNDEPGLSLASESGYVDEETLVKVTGKLCTRGYKSGTSPWELLLIPNKFKSSRVRSDVENTAPKAVLCLRIHHSLGDGHSILAFVASLFQYRLSSYASVMRGPKRHKVGVILTELLSLCRIPYDLGPGVRDALIGRNAWKPGRGELSGENVTFCSGRIPWERFRAVMSKYGVSSNAAVYAISAGAVVRLMKEAGLEIPNTSISTIVPYPKPNHPGGLANHVVGTYFSFNPRVHCGGRLVHRVGKQIRRMREGNRMAETIGRIQAISFLFPAWLWHCLSRRTVASTFVFSNFIGPQEIMTTAGLRLVDNICSMGHDPATGIYGLMTSDLGKLRIFLNVDSKIFEGAKIPRGFAKHVVQEIEDLLNHQDTVCTPIPRETFKIE